MTCREVAEKLMQTPDLPVAVLVDKGWGEFVEEEATEVIRGDLWNGNPQYPRSDSVEAVFIY